MCGGGEEPERVPAVTPRSTGSVLGVEDREVHTCAAQVVPGGEPGLAAADDHDLVFSATVVHGFARRVFTTRTSGSVLFCEAGLGGGEPAA